MRFGNLFAMVLALTMALPGMARATTLLSTAGTLTPDNGLAWFSVPLQQGRSYGISVQFSHPAAIEALYNYSFDALQIDCYDDGSCFDSSNNQGGGVDIFGDPNATALSHMFAFQTPASTPGDPPSGPFTESVYYLFVTLGQLNIGLYYPPDGNSSPIDYELNVSQVGGVPEPAIWALLILGFAGVGAAMRSHRRRAGDHGRYGLTAL